MAKKKKNFLFFFLFLPFPLPLSLSGKNLNPEFGTATKGTQNDTTGLLLRVRPPDHSLGLKAREQA
jgi:hypothetical protein